MVGLSVAHNDVVNLAPRPRQLLSQGGHVQGAELLVTHVDERSELVAEDKVTVVGGPVLQPGGVGGNVKL